MDKSKEKQSVEEKEMETSEVEEDWYWYLPPAQREDDLPSP